MGQQGRHRNRPVSVIGPPAVASYPPRALSTKVESENREATWLGPTKVKLKQNKGRYRYRQSRGKHSSSSRVAVSAASAAGCRP